VYEGLAEAFLHPGWVSGISIGAINSALIAGNPPEARVERLRQFWELVTDPLTVTAENLARMWQWIAIGASSMSPSDVMAHGCVPHDIANQLSAALALVRGAPGFFAPRLPTPWLQSAGTLGATSFYDTAQLKATLERLVDFDRINAGAMRFSVGAVNVSTGNLVYFDNSTHTIGPEHVMASGALPPSFPAIEIEGE
jgi:NTE family protein